MFHKLVFLLVICFFSSLCVSQGFSQEFYQTLPTYSAPVSYQPYSVESYPVQGYPVQSFPVQDYSVQSLPVEQYAAPAVTSQLPAYGSAGTSSQVYVPGYGMMEHVINPNYGYSGPGDMRTHLWKDHANDLKANGVSRAQLDSMPMTSVQKWHNFFHGTEGRPSQ